MPAGSAAACKAILMQASTKHDAGSATHSGKRAAAGGVERAFRFADLSAYGFKQRLLMRAGGLVGYLVLLLLGRTVRFELAGLEHWEAATRDGRPPILSVWHNRLFIGTYFLRRRSVVVMTSRSSDAEYSSRLVQRFGFGVVRGSSTRGGSAALLKMVRVMRAGFPTAFTIDGPRGPRYVAKMGALLLAKKTGCPILPFTITPAHSWELPTWDRLLIPVPFTRALMIYGEPLYVPPDADSETLHARRDDLQRALDGLEVRGEAWRAGFT